MCVCVLKHVLCVCARASHLNNQLDTHKHGAAAKSNLSPGGHT